MVKYLTILVLLAVNIIESRKLFTVTQMTCNNLDSSFCTFLTCQYSNIDPKSEVNIYLKLLQLPVDNCKLRIKLKKHNGEKTNIIYKLNIDACEFMKNRETNRVMNTFYSMLGFSDYSNINHSCPYNHDIILNKAQFNEKYINVIPVPVGQYSVEGVWIVNEVPKAVTTLGFKYYEK